MDEKLIRLMSQFALLAVICWVGYQLFGSQIVSWESNLTKCHQKGTAQPQANQVHYTWPKL